MKAMLPEGLKQGMEYYIEHGIEPGNLILVWTKALDQHIIAHECLHAANFTLRERGYRLDLYNDESQAYLFMAIYKGAMK